MTGASGGIGYALADLLAAEGCDLILVSRSEDKLREIAGRLQSAHGISARVIAQDLAHASAPEAIFDRVNEAGLCVDFLINNAGFGTHGFFAQSSLANQLEMLQVNATALTHLTRLFLPAMVQKGAGKILNVASTAAFQPGPLMAVYYASKAYVLSFSEAIAHELRGSGVTVTTLCPGPTTTGFQRRAGVGDTPLMQGRIADAASVAAAGLRGMMQAKAVVIPGARNRLLVFFFRFMPRRLALAAVRRIQEKREKLRGQ